MNTNLYKLEDLQTIKDKAKRYCALFKTKNDDPFYKNAEELLIMVMLIKKSINPNLTFGRILNDIGDNPNEWVAVEMNKVANDSFFKDKKDEYLPVFESLICVPQRTLKDATICLREDFAGIINEFAIPRR